MMQWLLIGAGGTLLVGWVGYPLVLEIASRLRSAPRPPSVPQSAVSFVLATREAPEAVRERLENLVLQGLSAGPAEMIVALDASVVTHRNAYAMALDGLPSLRLTGGTAPGKAAALNAGVAEARHEIVVFVDTAQRSLPGTVEALVGYLDANPDAGAVSGGYEATGRGSAAGVLGRFWSYERLLRRAESRLHSLVAVTGANYAMRRALWEPLPVGTICDDLFVPLRIVRRGWRVGFVEDALVHDPRIFSRADEFRRKVRTLTGMVQFIRDCPWILLPFGTAVWFQFVCHKLVRLFTPHLALLTLLGAIGVGAWRLLAVLLFVGAAGLSVLQLARPELAGRVRQSLLSIFVFQAAPIIATWRGLLGRWDVWQPNSRSA